MTISCQMPGQDLFVNNKKETVKFSYENGFLIVDVVLNNYLPLTFIFDTGAQNTIIFDKLYADVAQCTYDDEVRVIGADLNVPLLASIARNVRLTMYPLPAVTRDIVVLQEDLIHLDELIGRKVHGILGSDFFRNVIVEIDYEKSKICFYDPLEFNYRTLDDYSSQSVKILRGKVYLNCPISYKNGYTKAADFLLDTGAALSLLVHHNQEDSLVLPEYYVRGSFGQGLGGALVGYIGVVDSLKVLSFNMPYILTNFQDIDSSFLMIESIEREGIIGNLLLSKFKIFLDYRFGKLYVKPSKYFKDEFLVNKTGMTLIAQGLDLNEFVVSSVIEGSQAHKVGIKKGDFIKKVGPWFSRKRKLTDVLDYFSRDDGKKVQFELIKNKGTMREIHKRIKMELLNPFIKH